MELDWLLPGNCLLKLSRNNTKLNSLAIFQEVPLQNGLATPSFYIFGLRMSKKSCCSDSALLIQLSCVKVSVTCLSLSKFLNFAKDKFRESLQRYLKLSFGVQGWRSGESTPLQPMWAGFDSQTRRHMWFSLETLRLRRSSSSCEPRTSTSHVTSALPSGLRFEVHVCTTGPCSRGQWFTASFFAP